MNGRAPEPDASVCARAKQGTRRRLHRVIGYTYLAGVALEGAAGVTAACIAYGGLVALRSFALTFAAVTLRIYLGVFVAAGAIPFQVLWCQPGIGGGAGAQPEFKVEGSKTEPGRLRLGYGSLRNHGSPTAEAEATSPSDSFADRDMTPCIVLRSSLVARV